MGLDFIITTFTVLTEICSLLTQQYRKRIKYEKRLIQIYTNQQVPSLNYMFFACLELTFQTH